MRRFYIVEAVRIYVIIQLRTYSTTEGLLPPEFNATFCFGEFSCFLAGDERNSETPNLAMMHTMWVREHNRVVWRLRKLNPHWDDERLYQEGRHIVVGLYQYITYREFLEVVLGSEVMKDWGISVNEEVKFNFNYNPDIDASLSNGLMTAAFRYGHSSISTNIECG